MVRIVLLVVFAAALFAGSVGCKSPRGDREFIPGRGWTPVK